MTFEFNNGPLMLFNEGEICLPASGDVSSQKAEDAKVYDFENMAQNRKWVGMCERVMNVKKCHQRRK